MARSNGVLVIETDVPDISARALYAGVAAEITKAIGTKMNPTLSDIMLGAERMCFTVHNLDRAQDDELWGADENEDEPSDNESPQATSYTEARHYIVQHFKNLNLNPQVR